MDWLALDLGSSYTKCGRIDVEKKIQEYCSIPAPKPLKTLYGRYEVDAEAYFAQVYELITKMLSDETAGILISTQMHGWILTSSNFQPVTPYISWQDQSALEKDKMGISYLEVLREKIHPQNMLKSGVMLNQKQAMCTLYARLQRGLELQHGWRFCSLGGYIIGKLTGEHVCHITNAAPTGLMDVEAAAWSAERIEAVGCRKLVFPKILTGFNPAGVMTIGSRKIVVYPDIGDHQVCMLGVNPLRSTTLNVNIGTAGLIGALTDRFEDGAYENRPWIEPGIYLRSISGLPGGRHLSVLYGFYESVLRKFLPEMSESQQIWDMMTNVDTVGNLEICTDFFSNKGVISKIGEKFDVDGLNASFYSAIANQYAKAADKLALPLQEIRFSGGCAQKNAALRHAISLRIGKDGKDTVFDMMTGMYTLARKAQQQLN